MDDLIEQGVSAFKSGDRETARRLLALAIKQSPNDERAWGWMYNTCNIDQERILCLKQMIRINPNNQKYRNTLIKLENQILANSQLVPSYANSQAQKSITENHSIKKQKPSFQKSLLLLGVMVLLLLCIGGVVFGGSLISNNFASSFPFLPTASPPSPIIKVIQPSTTHRPSPPIPTPSMRIYLPTFPDNFEIDEEGESSNVGNRQMVVRYTNKKVADYGDLNSFIYTLNLYPSESKALSEYNKALNDSVSAGKLLLSKNNQLNLKGEDASEMYFESPANSKIVVITIISRVRNIVIITDGLAMFDASVNDQSDLLIFIAQVNQIQALGIEQILGQ